MTRARIRVNEIEMTLEGKELTDGLDLEYWIDKFYEMQNGKVGQEA